MKDLLQVLVLGGIFAVVLLPLVVAHDMFFPFITGKNFGFRILVEIIFASWVVLALLDETYRPKFSWIVATMAGFTAVIALAGALGEHPGTSFWSNYERMDGVVTLIHLFMYVLVVGSVMRTEKMWTIFLHASVAVALAVAVKGLFALQTTTGARVDSTLGNAAYMAVYMLFHIFFVALLFVRTKDVWFRLGYVLVALIFVYTMLQTGTRGTFLGLAGGSLVTVVYIALFGAKFPEFRKVAVGGLAGLVLLGGLFYSARDSEFVQSNPSMARIANIDIKADLVTRGTIWGMAIEGVEERPILGWGHGNFNFVFNKNYEASLHGQEQWFDRSHNLFLDWLIAGGIVGFIAYFSIFGAIVYYLFLRPLVRPSTPEAEDLNVLERAIILGLLTAYTLHNFVVFDNIISYIFFGTMLAYIHVRVSRPIEGVVKYKIRSDTVTAVVAPIVLVFALTTIYYVNIPSMLAAGDIIDGLRGTSISARQEAFEQALGRNGFGRQEIVEQMAQQAVAIARNPEASAEERDQFIQQTILELQRLIEYKPGDARIHLFLANLYRSIGSLPEAREQVEIARELTPDKPSVMLEQGVVSLQEGKLEESRDYFKEAYERVPNDVQIRMLYASMLVSTGETEEARALLDEPQYLEAFAFSDFSVSNVEQAGEYEFLAELYEVRIEKNPQDRQNWVSLSFVYNELGETAKSAETLRTAGEQIPDFARQAECIAGNIESGRDPNTPCTE